MPPTDIQKPSPTTILQLPALTFSMPHLCRGCSRLSPPQSARRRILSIPKGGRSQGTEAAELLVKTIDMRDQFTSHNSWSCHSSHQETKVTSVTKIWPFCICTVSETRTLRDLGVGRTEESGDIPKLAPKQDFLPLMLLSETTVFAPVHLHFVQISLHHRGTSPQNTTSKLQARGGRNRHTS